MLQISNILENNNRDPDVEAHRFSLYICIVALISNLIVIFYLISNVFGSWHVYQENFRSIGIDESVALEFTIKLLFYPFSIFYIFAYIVSLFSLLRRKYFLGKILLLVTVNLNFLSAALFLGESVPSYLMAPIIIALPFFLFSKNQVLFTYFGLFIGVGATVLSQVLSAPFDMTVHTPLGVGSEAFGAGRQDIQFARYFELLLVCILFGLGLARYHRRAVLAQHLITKEKQRSEELLLNILPKPIADRLGSYGRPIANEHEKVTVLFADIVGFTEWSRTHSPEEVVSLLDQIFSSFDDLATQHGVEKIKTVGDAYMAGSGIPASNKNHAASVANLALDMLDYLETVRTSEGLKIEARIGIHSGRVIAGIIGKSKFSYDIWGDTVNQASRIESNGISSRICVSSDTYDLLKHEYQFEIGQLLQLKGIGDVQTYFLEGADHK